MDWFYYLSFPPPTLNQSFIVVNSVKCNLDVGYLESDLFKTKNSKSILRDVLKGGAAQCVGRLRNVAGLCY